ncbi:MAG: hypothetical protein K0S58_1149 [Nitrospira sp.]|nr:hypothetical protein [Nitrospira sp.]
MSVCPCLLHSELLCRNKRIASFQTCFEKGSDPIVFFVGLDDGEFSLCPIPNGLLCLRRIGHAAMIMETDGVEYWV